MKRIHGEDICVVLCCVLFCSTSSAWEEMRGADTDVVDEGTGAGIPSRAEKMAGVCMMYYVFVYVHVCV